jgi:hypothetical protein
MRYIRDVMIDRLARDDEDGGHEGSGHRHRLEGDDERRRFRRMAEYRKRQILDRMLMEDLPAAGEGAGELTRSGRS